MANKKLLEVFKKFLSYSCEVLVTFPSRADLLPIDEPYVYVDIIYTTRYVYFIQ